MIETDVIRQVFASARPLGTLAWEIEGPASCRISISGSLLSLQAAIGCASASEALLRNAALPGSTRIVLLRSGYELRTETRWEQIREAREQFEAVWCGFGGNEIASVGSEDGDALDPAWQAREDSPGCWRVGLHGRQASFTAEWKQGVARVEFLTARRFDQDTSEAIAEVLLRTTAAVRQVRACARVEDGEWTVWIEARQGVGDEALFALSWVLDECAREVQALANSPGLAVPYRKFCSVAPAAEPMCVGTNEGR